MLRLQRKEQERQARAGVLTGKGTFIATYNTLIKMGKLFAYDEFSDKYFCDDREITGHVLAELRLLCARQSLKAPDRRTVQEAAQALCRLNRVSADHPLAHSPGAPLPWQDAIETMLRDAVEGGDQDLVRTITVHGTPFWFAPMRDIKLALDARGVEGARRIRAVMRALGWRARPAIVHGRRMQGFTHRARG